MFVKRYFRPIDGLFIYFQKKVILLRLVAVIDVYANVLKMLLELLQLLLI